MGKTRSFLFLPCFESVSGGVTTWPPPGQARYPPLVHGKATLTVRSVTLTEKKGWCFEWKNGRLGGGFKYFLCSPLPGEMIPNLTNIFQQGWNHQPGRDFGWKWWKSGFFQRSQPLFWRFDGVFWTFLLVCPKPGGLGLWKRNIIDSKVFWEGICDRSLEGKRSPDFIIPTHRSTQLVGFWGEGAGNRFARASSRSLAFKISSFLLHLFFGRGSASGGKKGVWGVAEKHPKIINSGWAMKGFVWVSFK